MRRVVIIGTSGSGKTTLARQLASKLNVRHIELDELHWEPDWTATPTPRFREKIINALQAAPDGWTLCGNYRKVRDAIWPSADTIIWLDYPMREVFTRVFVRTMKRVWTRELLWSGCRESLWIQFCSSESLFLWVIDTWRRQRRDYPAMLRGDECRHLRVLRFRSPAQTQAWLDRIAPC
jgi:adenylate kinase family enzyme